MTTWPLFWCLSIPKRAELMEWYWDTFKMHLVIPPNPIASEPVIVGAKIEPLKEIDHIMRQPPKRLKRVVK